MAFTTLPGANGTDFTGTENVDILFALNVEGEITVDGKGGNDNITLSNASSVVGAATVKAGAGNDSITATTAGAVAGSARFDNSLVNGQAGNDSILSTGAVSSALKGGDGDDDFTLSGNYTNSTVNGNKGVDSINIADGGAITLSNAKILGGKGNDGAMNFATNGNATTITAAADSTINGNIGVDSITIGQVTAATNFFVYGGQDGDVITSANNGADGITYSGDKGADAISITGNADAIVNGGSENDTLTFGASTGDHTIDGGDGDDTISLSTADSDSSVVGGAGDDTITDRIGDDSITGGVGADTFVTDDTAGDENRYLYAGVSDSSPAFGTDTTPVQTFDTYGLDAANGVLTAAFTAANDIDITGFANQLAGNTIITPATANLADQEVVLDANVIAVTNIDTFSALATAINTAGLTASTGNGQIQANFITADNASLIGGTVETAYVVLNNGNAVLDAGDMMFEIGVAGDNGTNAANSAAAFIAAVNAAF